MPNYRAHTLIPPLVLQAGELARQHGCERSCIPEVADGEAAKELILRALSPGGIVVLDDLSPEEHWPEAWRGRPDPVREVRLNDPRLNATEVVTTPTTVAILATLVG